MRSALYGARREGNAGRVIKRNGGGRWEVQRCEVSGRGLWRSGDLCDESRGPRLGAFLLRGVTELHKRRRVNEAHSDGLCQIPVAACGGVRHACFTLYVEWQERMRGTGSRPTVFISGEEPDSIGGESGGFGG